MKELSVVKQNFIQYIDHILQNKKVSHTYLIEITDYAEDMQYVLDFVKMILCNCSYFELKNSDNPVVHLIDQGNYPDLKIIEPDGNLLKKAQMIDLQKEYSNKSLMNNKRIYIIKNVEKFNTASANTMLKFLEEPEDDIVAILLTNNRYSVLDTILSRCQVLSLKEDSIVINSDPNVLELLKCILNPRSFFIQYNHFINDVIVDKNVAKELFLEVEADIIRILNSNYLVDSNINSDIKDLIKNIDMNVLVNKLSVLGDEIPKLDFNVNYKLWLDALFSKLIIGG